MKDDQRSYKLAIELEPESVREVIRAVSTLMQTTAEIAVNKVEIAIHKTVIDLLTPIVARTKAMKTESKPPSPSAEFVELLQDQVGVLQERCARLDTENDLLRSENQQLRDAIVAQTAGIGARQ